MTKYLAFNKPFLIITIFFGLQGNLYASNDAVTNGEYIVRITGCNDCHTPGYAEKGGNVPTSQWLTGSAIGFKGPWGVSYPANLRLLMQNLTEDQWVIFSKNLKARPPMPWFTLHMMSEPHLRDVHQFVRSLGPAGALSPNFVPPGGVIKTKYIDFVPTSANHWSGFSHITPK
jgi:mono/diheme cytochrome c family protein